MTTILHRSAQAGHARRARRKRPVAPARFRSVTLHLPAEAASTRRKAPRWIAPVALLLLASGAFFGLPAREEAPAQVEEVFLIEDAPPLTDPAPPPPEPPEPVPAPAPSPQFGSREDAPAEAGDLEATAGNTLMAEADTMTREPVADLPAAPQMLDQAPRLLRGRPPEYPARALDRGLEATVVVVILIDTLGRVTDVAFEKSGGREFDPSVEAAVRRLVFQPPARGGKAVPARFRQLYEFKLE